MSLKDTTEKIMLIKEFKGLIKSLKIDISLKVN